jgi:hypothetical protein
MHCLWCVGHDLGINELQFPNCFIAGKLKMRWSNRQPFSGKWRQPPWWQRFGRESWSRSILRESSTCAILTHYARHVFFFFSFSYLLALLAENDARCFYFWIVTLYWYSKVLNQQELAIKLQFNIVNWVVDSKVYSTTLSTLSNIGGGGALQKIRGGCYVKWIFG